MNRDTKRRVILALLDGLINFLLKIFLFFQRNGKSFRRASNG